MIGTHFWLISVHYHDERAKTDTYCPEVVAYSLIEAETFVNSISRESEYTEELLIDGKRIQVRPDVPINDLWQEYIISRVDSADMRSEIDKREHPTFNDAPGFANFTIQQK